MITHAPKNNIPVHISNTTEGQRQPGTKEVDKFDNRCAELCVAIFQCTPNGKELLSLWEQHYFFSPVAIPGMNEHTPYFIDGTNNFIRQIRKWSSSKKKDPDAQPVQMQRSIEHG